MTQSLPPSPSTTPTPPNVRAVQGRSTDGVLLSRAVAYLVDIVIIAGLGLIASLGIALLGLITFGLGWMLFPIVGVGVAMAYAALTIGGPRQATLGMRAAGARVERVDGYPPDGITAAAHALLFYVAMFTLGLFLINVLFGVFRADGRMGHDLLTGLIVVRN